MIDIIKVLENVAELEYWTDYSPFGDDAEERTEPPIIIWRHKRPSPSLADFFRDTIGAFRGAIVWEFSATEPNWGLMPARLREYTIANNLLGELDAAAELSSSDPDFGKRANAELPLLAAHIAQAAAKRAVA
jgi:hypothetical protein